jgi:Ca2+-binding EF-hand superfamily protein
MGVPQGQCEPPIGVKNGGGQRASFAVAEGFAGVFRAAATGKVFIFRLSGPGTAFARYLVDRLRRCRGRTRSFAMLFAGLAASAAVDLLSLLQPEKASAKGGTSLRAQSSFSVADPDAVETAQAQPQFPAAPRTESLSRDALDTLLSAQGQEAAKRKKRSTSVLLDVLQSSQKGSVKKSEFETAVGESGGNASELFDKIDHDHDGSINTAEMSLYLNAYKRNAGAGANGGARSLAMLA